MKPHTEQLKPCPFCGQAGKMVEGSMSFLKGYPRPYIAVGCFQTICPIRPHVSLMPEFRETMIKDWNTRAAPPVPAQGEMKSFTEAQARIIAHDIMHADGLDEAARLTYKYLQDTIRSVTQGEK